MAKTAYSEKLKDPRWQKIRLQVLQRDKFQCILCVDTETELHIHHEVYVKEPWDAPLSKLKTVCKDCHFVYERKYPERIVKAVKTKDRHRLIVFFDTGLRIFSLSGEIPVTMVTITYVMWNWITAEIPFD